MNNIIKSIELDNEFKYPLIYKELLKDKMLDYIKIWRILFLEAF